MSTPTDLYRLSYNVGDSRRSTALEIELTSSDAAELERFIQEIVDRPGNVTFKCERIETST